ncbi:MAG: amino acid permease [Firmicutes bacterium]|nr:amino acid permease [Bacillota bacterium]
MPRSALDILSTVKDALKRGLGSRHLSMISIGGVIGVGMFLGSGATVRLGGPGVVLSYLLGGVIMMMVMLALGEMSVAYPVPGSFRVYASQYLSPFVGYVTGWLYWVSWVGIMAAEIVAATVYMEYWFPGAPNWIFGALFAVLMTVINLVSVRSFGEFEFWFSLVKVIAIVAFIVVGTAAITGAGARFGVPAIGLANYTGQGGFFPNGVRGVALAMVMVMLAYGGTEVIGVAAAETKNPEVNVPLAIRGVVVRTLVLYVGSIAVLVGVIPWTRAGLTESPFVSVFGLVGIRKAATLMNLVVISAALSSMNSGLYTSSRMLHSLASQGMAPVLFSQVSTSTGVPYWAVLASTASLYLGVLAYYVSPHGAFLFVAGISAFGFFFSWLVITLTHLRFRPAVAAAEPWRLKFKAPGFPHTSIITSILLVVVTSALWLIPEQRMGLYAGLVLLAFISLAYALGFLLERRRPGPALEPGPMSRPAEALRLASYFGFEQATDEPEERPGDGESGTSSR